MKYTVVLTLLIPLSALSSEQQTSHNKLRCSPSAEILIQAHSTAVSDFNCASTEQRIAPIWKWEHYKAAKKQYKVTLAAMRATNTAIFIEMMNLDLASILHNHGRLSPEFSQATKDYMALNKARLLKVNL